MDTSENLAGQLVERRLLSPEEMERVMKLQQEQQAPFTRLLVELGFLSEDDLLPVLRDHFNIPFVSLKDFPTTPLPIEFFPGVADFFKLARIVPLKIEGRELMVATTDPLDLSRLHAVELAAGPRVKPVLAKEKEITPRIAALFGNGYSSDSRRGGVAGQIGGAPAEGASRHPA